MAAICTPKLDAVGQSWPPSGDEASGYMLYFFPGRWSHTLGVCDIPREVPAIPGCYAIYSGGRLMYIGSAVNLCSRLAGHSILKRLRQRSRVKVKVRASARYGDWLMVEARLLRRLRPPLNKHGCCDAYAKYPHRMEANL